ncbi:MAG: hypothetical protein ACR2J8_05895 [Thermomicrobiales bacterium]
MDFTFGQVIETAASGNGGAANASANGGAGALGDINSGGNFGSAIGVGNTSGSMVCDDWGKCYPGDGGSVAVNGGQIANSTSIGVSMNGGTAISDATGGDYNVAFVS